MRIWVLALLAAVLSGCAASSDERRAGEGGGSATSPSPAAVASIKPSEASGASPSAVEGLHAIQDIISGRWEELREKHSLELLLSAVHENEIQIEVRSFGEVERIPTKEELRAFEDNLYELAGGSFPVRIGVRECCSGSPQVTGKIEGVDRETNRILIVSEKKKNGNTDNPLAHWVGLSPDGRLYAAGEEPTDVLEDDLVGKQAEAWTSGMTLQSYPEQTVAFKIVVK
ncbi:hypothetical protein [Cohnella boryungensis]|uniref:DUF4362 domain-containing protein n=1 Tax=Cohnella boryungensis TaxID=768479 RepID=A0ABV8SAM8_9BACL